jgi:hypothetical protein
MLNQDSYKTKLCNFSFVMVETGRPRKEQISIYKFFSLHTNHARHPVLLCLQTYRFETMLSVNDQTRLVR